MLLSLVVSAQKVVSVTSNSPDVSTYQEKEPVITVDLPNDPYINYALQSPYSQAALGYYGLTVYEKFLPEIQLGTNLSVRSQMVFSYTENYHFIQLPLHVRYQLNDKWSVFTGPKLDTFLDRTGRYGDAFNAFGTAIDVGLRYDATENIFAEISYSYSLSNQSTNAAYPFYAGQKSTLQIGSGFKF